MDHFIIERQGIQNLDFNGEVIGQSGGPTPRIKIYRTDGKKYVIQWDANQKFSKAEHFDTPDLLIIYYRNNFGIGPEVEDAIEDAAKHDDSFKVAWNENVS